MPAIRDQTTELLAALLTAFLALVPAFSAAASRPNILLVVGDDLGWGDIRPNNADGKVELPTIERLAKDGVRFTDAHTFAAKCAPSRYSILTGNYQWRGRFGWGNWKYKGGSQVLAGQTTLGHLLKGAGYATAIVGKYHQGANFYRVGSTQFATGSDPDTAVDFSRAMVDGPPAMGFDYSFVAMRGIQAGPYAFFEDGRLYGWASDLMNWPVGNYGNTEIIEAGIGLPDWVTRDVGPTLLSKALGFIDSHHSAQAGATDPQPFFLYVAMEAVHGPRKPPIAIGGRAVLGTSGLGSRTDMLVEIDAVLEALTNRLQQLGLLENTLIIFTSDNGGSSLYSEKKAGHLTSGKFRGDKGTIYEGGHRVPMIMKWGTGAAGISSLPAGTVIDSLVAVPDLYSTLAELVGAPVGADQGRDSFSLLPILQQHATTTRNHIVSEADEPEDTAADGGISGRHFAYRSGTWKLIFNGSRLPVALYDLSSDPYEKTNLIARPEQAERASALRAGLEQALASTRTAPILSGGGNDYSLDPLAVAFGNQALNTPSSYRTVSLTNRGSTVLAITSVSLAGMDRAQFSQSSGCGSSLPAGNACTIQVRFNPTSVGPKVAQLVVTTNGGGDARQVSLSGTGIGSAAAITPASLAFGNVASGKVSAALMVTISNGTAARLPIKSVTMTGTNHAQFLHVNACPAELAAGATCTVPVSFRPKSKGPKSASLIVSLGGMSPTAILLAGTGV